MDLSYSEEYESFRTEVQDFIAAKDPICHGTKCRQVRIICSFKPCRTAGPFKRMARSQRRSIKGLVDIDHDN